MPELPDVTVYIEALERRIGGRRLEKIRLKSPFLLRSIEPRPAEAEGRAVTGLSRIGKRIVIALEGELHLVVHLMIAGRFRWKARGAGIPGKIGLAAFDFDAGTLLLTEASSK
jgi:formamidopyrimidine-DNA glycosylase